MNHESQEQHEQQGWSLSYSKKSFYSMDRPRPITVPSAKHGIERWKIEPKSIFDYDPIEDGKESLSLAYLHKSDERTVYEGYGQREFHRAREDNSLGIEEFYDPAHNNKPFLASFHPCYRNKSTEPPNKSGYVTKNPNEPESGTNTSYGRKEEKRSERAEEALDDLPDSISSQPQTSIGMRPFVYSPIPFGHHEFTPQEFPVYTNFNRVPAPFMKK